MAHQGKEPIAKTAHCGETDAVPENRGIVLPDTDIFEDDTNFYLTADLPGVDKGAVELSLEKGVLTVHGAVTARDHDGCPVFREIGRGDFERSFRLSDAIDAEKIEAKMEQGVLHLTLPKAVPAQARKIAVKTS